MSRNIPIFVHITLQKETKLQKNAQILDFFFRKRLHKIKICFNFASVILNTIFLP